MEEAGVIYGGTNVAKCILVSAQVAYWISWILRVKNNRNDRNQSYDIKSVFASTYTVVHRTWLPLVFHYF